MIQSSDLFRKAHLTFGLNFRGAGPRASQKTSVLVLDQANRADDHAKRYKHDERIVDQVGHNITPVSGSLFTV